MTDIHIMSGDEADDVASEVNRLRAENESLREEVSKWQEMTAHFMSLNEDFAEQIKFWMKEAKEQRALHEAARELGRVEGRVLELQEQTLKQADATKADS